MSNKILRKSIHYALDKIPNSLPEWIPSKIVEKNEGDNKLDVPYNSKSAKKMSQKEINEIVEWV